MICAMLTALLGTQALSSQASPVAHTTFGDVVGTSLSHGVDQYLGIPFAHAPRFQDPIDWSTRYEHGRYLALRPGSRCPQPASAIHAHAHSDAFSESCLFLNVWTPATAQTSSLPVQVFIHGGNWQNGGGDDYNATQISHKHSSVVVTLNYRLGAFGWLHLDSAHANFGLKDQRAGLRWVKNHIHGFGGDSSRVLLFGESAGAIAVSAHLVSPASRGLFGSAIMESGTPTCVSFPQAIQTRGVFLNAAGCNRSNTSATLTCLRLANLTTLEEASEVAVPSGARVGMRDPFDKPTWGPTVDGSNEGLPAEPLALLKSGAVANVSLLAGTNTDEGSVFVYSWYSQPMNSSAFLEFTASLIQNRLQPGVTLNVTTLQALLRLYKPDDRPNSDNRPLAVRMSTDMLFKCGTRTLARALSKQNAYMYRFDFRSAYDTTPLRWGVTHGSEVPFVFDQLNWISGNSSTIFSDSEENFATAIGSMWRKLAQTGSLGPRIPDTEFVLTPCSAPTCTSPFRLEPIPHLASCALWASFAQPEMAFVV